jgi:hypothetical protein
VVVIVTIYMLVTAFIGVKLSVKTGAYPKAGGSSAEGARIKAPIEATRGVRCGEGVPSLLGRGYTLSPENFCFLNGNCAFW